MMMAWISIPLSMVVARVSIPLSMVVARISVPLSVMMVARICKSFDVMILKCRPFTMMVTRIWISQGHSQSGSYHTGNHCDHG